MAFWGLSYRCRNRKDIFPWIWEKENLGLLWLCQPQWKSLLVTEENKVSNKEVDLLEKTLMLGGIEGRRKRDDRGWDGWMATLIRWTWVWVNSGSWWWTGRPGVLQFMGLQRVRHNWVTELNWTELNKELGRRNGGALIFNHFKNKIPSYLS